MHLLPSSVFVAFPVLAGDGSAVTNHPAKRNLVTGPEILATCAFENILKPSCGVDCGACKCVCKTGDICGTEGNPSCVSLKVSFGCGAPILTDTASTPVHCTRQMLQYQRRGFNMCRLERTCSRFHRTSVAHQINPINSAAGTTRNRLTRPLAHAHVRLMTRPRYVVFAHYTPWPTLI